MNMKLLSALVIIVFCYSVWPAGDYPKVIQKVIDLQSKNCKEKNKGALTVNSYAIQSFRLNDDQAQDYLVDESGFECTTDQNMRGGAEPIRIKVYLSQKQQWKLAWSGMILAYKFDKKSSQLVLEMKDKKDPVKVIKRVLKVNKASARLVDGPM